ncbi:VTT domain-containing protein [Desulfurivibrio dismutans]|uniref:VTT domain-containing protein n=1 Tax=Desulfurivibrio dismutans TaxID=1398908 RepID=UPI0023DAD0C1|nr:VTT domain-containing protein [Desulfurivibrio alkaliphilus]MDF1615335.1 VTT domain-containing protein [Desulfurivibrio alkaliphilus]
MAAFNRRKSALVLAIVLLAGAFFWFDLHHYLTLEQIRGFQEQARHFYQQRPLTAIVSFAGTYLLVVALNLPGGALLGLLAGAVFGVLVGTVVVSFASTIAATVACALSRYLFRDLIKGRFPGALTTVDRGIAKEGAFYLFSLRLIPVVPFFIINMVMGLTAMPLRTFYWVSQLGMLPGTFVFVNAGSELGRLASTGEIFSPRLLLAFALLGLLPLVANRLLSWYRKSGKQPASSTNQAKKGAPGLAHADYPKALAQAAAELADQCTMCGACAARCALLQESGLPGEIAASGRHSGNFKVDPFACSLCHLCTAICPEKLTPGDFFLNLRRQKAAQKDFDLRPYRPILSYERLGASRLFAAESLPTGCTTAFFPGCTLPGTRPAATRHLVDRLRELKPSLGLVLNCCHKPSHDLGRQQYFAARFGALQQRLLAQGVREILVACPNCYKVFLQYGGKLKVKSVWELLAATNEGKATVTGKVTVHDPCPLRQRPELQHAVRQLATSQGLKIEEMKSTGKRTLCCGEGGAVGLKRPDLAARWGALRKKQAQELPVLTYCAGCAGFLNRAGLNTIHLADLLAEPHKALTGNTKAAAPPRTYLNRLLFKFRLPQ